MSLRTATNLVVQALDVLLHGVDELRLILRYRSSNLKGSKIKNNKQRKIY